MKTEIRQLVWATGALALATMLGGPVRAGTPEDTMTVSRTVNRSSTQTQCPARRSTVGRCETRSVLVSYGDLDLASQGGAETLYRRLQGAAMTVCGARDGLYVPYVEVRRKRAQCVGTTLDDAVAATGIERVVAVHRDATGRVAQSGARLAGAP